MYKLQRLIGFAILLLCSAAHAGEKETVNQDNPYVLLQVIAGNTFNRFEKELPEIQKNPEILKDIVTQELLPYIDYTYASFKVLGNNNLKKMKPEQIKSFIGAFKDYMVAIYAQVFTNFKASQKVYVEPSKNYGDSKIVVVKSKITEPGHPDIDIYFKLRKKESSDGVTWLAYDMDAEGISMLDTKRKEINEAIKRSGIESVISDLRRKAQNPLVLSDGKG
ncbi:MlaC/ttg2D family ABC transporter substrate-binding protein [Algibacillus agarilyticus]|uniref:MlaC/ttg2D family ABC transporter substrate-binding protein n=1 Tax=Algibacillus agarilyticus TaxID=2234133 RepID=UPI0013007A2A|nr:ABC transporter substrate-binding protein [Algibacillus agarilyticus]